MVHRARPAAHDAVVILAMPPVGLVVASVLHTLLRAIVALALLVERAGRQADADLVLALEDSPMHAVGARRLALAVVLLALGGLHPALHTAAALLRHVALLRADGLPILALHDVVVLLALQAVAPLLAKVHAQRRVHLHRVRLAFRLRAAWLGVNGSACEAVYDAVIMAMEPIALVLARLLAASAVMALLVRLAPGVAERPLTQALKHTVIVALMAVLLVVALVAHVRRGVDAHNARRGQKRGHCGEERQTTSDGRHGAGRVRATRCGYQPVFERVRAQRA
mmetsp:Transcript_18515/g.52668  ORF Transcript_18515/g.52668 Transcript_18515/m.52668 type:complete len:281 (-) Transcript_18515:7-849(-)